MGKILKILAGIVVLLVVALGIFISTFDVNKYKGKVISLAEEKTGRDFDVAGDLALGVSLIPTIKVEGVKLGNADWGSAPDMITVKTFEMQVGLIPLLSGDIKINQLTLDTAEILLETSKDGTSNWEFKPMAEKATEEKTGETGPPKVNVNEINVKNSSLTYKDGKTGKTTTVKIDNFVLERGTFSQSLDVVIAAVYNNVPVALDGSIGLLANFTENEKFPLDIKANVGDVTANIKGSVDKPKTFEGTDLEIDFNANSLKPLSTLTGKELPEIGPLALTGHITEVKGNYQLDSVNAQLLDSHISVDGQVSSTKPQEEFDLNIVVETATLANFNKIKDIIKTEFPDIGPLNLNGHIMAKESFYHLDKVNISLDKDTALLNGKLSVEKPLEGFDVETKLNIQNLARYNALTGQKLPDKGPLVISGHVSEKDGIYLFKSVNAQLPNSKLTVDGKLTNLKQTEGSDLNINFESTSLADLNGIAGDNLPALGPVSLIANVSDQKGSYHLKDMKFKADKTDLTGNMVINIKGERPVVNATLTSEQIDLVPFQGEKKEDPKQKKSKVFSSEPLPLESLKSVDTSLDITAKKIKTRDYDLDNVKLVMTLNNGKLSLKPLSTTMGGGNISVQMDLDASSSKTANMNTSINIKNFQPASLPKYKDKFTGGKTDADINVSGSGKSVAAIMASLNGKFLMQMGAGTFKSSATSAATADALSSLKNAIYGGKETSGDTQINCGVINLNIKDGIATADKGIAINTTKMNIIGSGIINLKTEEIDIAVDPQARDGVGISVGQLAELVKIGGTLAEPKAVPSTEAALKTAASVGAAVATGGISILAQGLFDKSTADSDPCATALGIKPKSTTTTTTTEATTTTKEEPKSVTEKATDTVKDAGSAIKDTFKGLFGD